MNEGRGVCSRVWLLPLVKNTTLFFILLHVYLEKKEAERRKLQSINKIHIKSADKD